MSPFSFQLMSPFAQYLSRNMQARSIIPIAVHHYPELSRRTTPRPLISIDVSQVTSPQQSFATAFKFGRLSSTRLSRTTAAAAPKFDDYLQSALQPSPVHV
jgi:hypothetical protein